MLSKLNGYKTYIVCAFTVAYAVVSGWNGTMTGQAEMDMILAALGAAGIRHGVSTSS